MRKIVLMVLAGMAAVGVSAQQKWHYDSTKVERLSEVVVSGVRVQKDAPYAVSNLKRQELAQFATSGQEMPLLFSRTPGVLAWSENGVGTGTTYMRIRGAGDSRINITLDGVPLNSPEDQCVFWANMNGYAAMLGSAQIQRGVGTSTNGDGAFGGTVSLNMKTPSLTPLYEVTASVGSYNTTNYRVALSLGAFRLGVGQLVIDGAYQETQTDGFIHGTDGRSGSYYGGAMWMKDKLRISYKNVGNWEKTGQAWNGVTAGNGDYSLMDGCYDDGSWGYQTATGIKTYKDLYNVGLGRYNSLYERLQTGDDGLFVRDAAGNYQTERYQMSDGTYWSRTTDNFWQNHNLLNVVGELSDQWTVSATLHYTHGHGYYDEFRPQNKPKKFGINYTSVKKTDFVRKKGLTQDVAGIVAHADYTDSRWNMIAGVSAQRFWGDHYGYLTYAADASLAERIGKAYKYYDSDAAKTDASAFVKAAYKLTDSWQVFGDVQYRHVGYKTTGINDRFYSVDGSWANQPLDVDEKYDFLNPKAGISWSQGPHHAYASVAMSHREPERNNFTDNYKYPFPKAESLLDYEVGYNFATRRVRLGANLYYMDYTDQFVQTGELSEIGEALTTNIKDSYRIGVELTAAWDVCSLLTVEANAALSQNKLKDFTEMASVNWEESFRAIHYDDATLAFSPSAILNGFVDFHWRDVKATWHTGYVSRQYLDNTGNKDRSLPAYTSSDFNVNYSFRVPYLKMDGTVGFRVNNVFDAHYAASGWVYSSILEDYGHPNENRYYQIGFIPMAGRTFMGSVTMRF
jgi:iron complex outermembrane receptor protein